MIFGGEFVTGIDLVDISLWTFTLFFFGLIFYLRREDRREGYPLETDTTGRLEDEGVVWYAPKKTFTLPHDRGTVSVPHGPRDTRKHAMARTAVWPGAPYQPTGNPLVDGIGPAAWAERMDIPDLTDDGRNRIVPFRDDHVSVAKEDADPRGMTVFGADKKPVGTVTDLWVDRSEAIIRYLEVELEATTFEGVGGNNRVLLPMPFAVIHRAQLRRAGRVDVDALYSHHFADVPRTKAPNMVTRLEEDKICGYFGGGKLYAHPDRSEPLA